MSDFLAFGAYDNQERDSKVDMGGASVQDSLPGAEKASAINAGQDIPESILIAD